MKEVMGSLARDTLAKACMSFRSRIEALFTADGSFIESGDCQYVSLLIVFYFNKIGWFSAVLCHLNERRKKFRIYRCHPVLHAQSRLLRHWEFKTEISVMLLLLLWSKPATHFLMSFSTNETKNLDCYIVFLDDRSFLRNYEKSYVLFYS